MDYEYRPHYPFLFFFVERDTAIRKNISLSFYIFDIFYISVPCASRSFYLHYVCKHANGRSLRAGGNVRKRDGERERERVRGRSGKVGEDTHVAPVDATTSQARQSRQDGGREGKLVAGRAPGEPSRQSGVSSERDGALFVHRSITITPLPREDSRPEDRVTRSAVDAVT